MLRSQIFAMNRSYRYLSTSRGAGNTLTPLLLNVLPFGIVTYLPREGSETFVQIAELLPYRLYIYLFTLRGAGNSKFTNPINSLFSMCIAPYLPREGPETIRQFELLVRHARIATYQPREGPETDVRT